jgi:hypothetical protein
MTPYDELRRLRIENEDLRFERNCLWALTALLGLAVFAQRVGWLA